MNAVMLLEILVAAGYLDVELETFETAAHTSSGVSETISRQK